MFAVTNPWYRPLWRRLALALVTFGWSAFEFAGGNRGWALLFLAIGAWVIWAMFITYRPPADRQQEGAGDAGSVARRDDEKDRP